MRISTRELPRTTHTYRYDYPSCSLDETPADGGGNTAEGGLSSGGDKTASEAMEPAVLPVGANTGAINDSLTAGTYQYAWCDSADTLAA